MGSEKTADAADRRVVAFAGPGAADRRVAGVAAAGRVVRALAEAGVAEVWLTVPGGGALAPATEADIARLRGPLIVHVTAPADAPADLVAEPAPAMNAMAILRATTKPSDGIVSRYLNRPISQRISWLALAIPGARPIHATIASALFAAILFWGMLAGGKTGLILGGILFQAASVIDGVDGEMARATWRATDFGKTLDSVIDMATNLAFVLALTLHLGRHGHPMVFWTGMWAVTLVTLGAGLIAWRVKSGGGPLSFDLLKPKPKPGPPGPVDALLKVGTFITSRDFFAFAFMVLIIAGLAWPALIVFTTVGTGWIVYVIGSLFAGRRAVRREEGYRGAA
jgi:1L-myo-inositol 1-phosphate cytidylyltransferase / CDP-L-myo-inositol myo-inositolphosphotransferase